MSTQIVPQHVAYPRTFISQRTYVRKDARWEVVAEDSDTPLNEQIKEFVDAEGAMVTQVSPPNVQIYSEEEDRRVYITSVSLLYIPAKEGTDDQPRNVDA